MGIESLLTRIYRDSTISGPGWIVATSITVGEKNNNKESINRNEDLSTQKKYVKEMMLCEQMLAKCEIEQQRMLVNEWFMLVLF